MIIIYEQILFISIVCVKLFLKFKYIVEIK